MRWDTLFLPAQNENLMKDVGLIPYFMMKEFGLDANIVSYDKEGALKEIYKHSGGTKPRVQVIGLKAVKLVKLLDLSGEANAH